MRLLVAGGGVAALEAVIALRELAEGRVSVELLSPKAEFAYRPLAVAEPFGSDPVMRYDLLAMVEDLGADFRLGTLHEVDAANRVVRTTRGEKLSWDGLLVAIGARMGIGLEGAVTIKGPGFTGRFRTVIRELEDRRVRRLTFAVPPGASWPLPLYELALMTAERLHAAGIQGARLVVVTPEDDPLEVFGTRTAQRIRALLAERGIGVWTRVLPMCAGSGALELAGGGTIAADHVVALPRLAGPRIGGLPHDADGFIPTDRHGAVPGTAAVWAAGDATTLPVKQGALAAQQADAAAEAIAAYLGADIAPQPFRPVLRALLFDPREPRVLVGDDSEHAVAPTWWPASKVAARHLAPYLAAGTGIGSAADSQ